MTASAGQQTSVSTPQSIGFPGLIGDSSNGKVSDARYNGEASASIPFGVGVARLNTDGTTKWLGAVKLNTSAAAMVSAFVGVTLHSHDYAPEIEIDSVGMKPKVVMNVMQRGRVWVQPEETVTPGDAVRCRVLAGAGSVGAFRTTADASNCIVLTKCARWITAGSSTVPAMLEFDLAGAGNITAD